MCVRAIDDNYMCVRAIDFASVYVFMRGFFYWRKNCSDGVFFFIRNTIKPVYKSYWRGPEDVAFMISCPLYTGSNYMHYSLMGKMRLTFTNRDLLYLEVPMIILVLKLHFNYLEGTINFTILRKQNQIELFNGTNINRQSI